jgi:hypothetical protein
MLLKGDNVSIYNSNKASNREVHERFQHSGETISRCIKEVLKSLCLFAVEVIKPVDPQFSNTLREFAMNPRYISHFKVRLIFFMLFK